MGYHVYQQPQVGSLLCRHLSVTVESLSAVMLVVGVVEGAKRLVYVALVERREIDGGVCQYLGDGGNIRRKHRFALVHSL